MPQGASTKNAGFACFGSLSELLKDLNQHTEEEVLELATLRWEGLKELRARVGDHALDFQMYGGHEIFMKSNPDFYEACLENIPRINKVLKPYFKEEVYAVRENVFGFHNVQDYYITNAFEGQLDTGRMMDSLLKQAYAANIKIFNSVWVDTFDDLGDRVVIHTNVYEFSSKKLFIATNGFAAELGVEDVLPARAQVLITKPIENLAVKGTFHIEEGFYYFRNIDNRILFGGGRNLDIPGETTTDFSQTALIQNRLEQILRSVILPNIHFDIEHRWSGIMGVGHEKRPIVKKVSTNVFCGVRLGGMGVAIGTRIGNQLAALEK